MNKNQRKSGRFLQKLFVNKYFPVPRFNHVTCKLRFLVTLNPSLLYESYPFHGSTWSSPIVWRTLRNYLSVVTSKLSVLTDFPEPVCIERVAIRLLSLITNSHNRAQIRFCVSTTRGSKQARNHPCLMFPVFR